MQDANTVSTIDGKVDTTPQKNSAAEQVQEIPIEQLFPFEGHPFKVRDDVEMNDLVDSMKQVGVTTPLIVRPLDDGNYEIISGHRRLRAAQWAEITTLPVIVRNIDRDEAIIQMVDSNLQRETILPSERAYAYKMKLEAMNRVLGRPEKGGQLGHNFKGMKSREILGQETGDSPRQVQRYIRLTNLIPEIMQMVDNKQIALNPAVEISYLTQEEQRNFVSAMDYGQATPSLAQAQKIKKLSKEKQCTSDAMEKVMNEEKKEDAWHITFTSKQLAKYFPKSYTPKQMEAAILKLLEVNLRKRQRDMSR